jgi:hypothetical protein
VFNPNIGIEFYLGEKGQGQTDVCVDRDRKCKIEAAKIEGLRKG